MATCMYGCSCWHYNAKLYKITIVHTEPYNLLIVNTNTSYIKLIWSYLKNARTLVIKLNENFKFPYTISLSKR
jgi:hypothetical protein